MLGGGGPLFRLLHPAVCFSRLTFGMVQASFQLRQPLFDRKRRGIGGEGRKKGAANRCAYHRDAHINPYLFQR
ncbi:hypothetical protein UA70_03735 [Raoultella planticola]|nr:hypothetical protein UA70_03735 [Raoultella planticola]